MKKLLFTMFMLVPMTLWAQDNTWEKPEVDEQEEVAKAKVNPDAKYLRGAVPVVNGKVLFSTHIDAPGKTAAQIYDILHQYMEKMTKEKNQLENSKLVTEDTQNHELVASFEEYRRLHGPLESLQQLSLLPDFPSEAIQRLEPYVEF